MDLNLTANLAGFFRVLDALPAALSPAQSPPVRAGVESAVEVLMEDSRQQFLANAQGGGTWAPPAESTRKAEAKDGKPFMGGEGSPLFDALFTAGADGHFVDAGDDGVTAGVRGGQHPGGRATLEQIAVWQHFGTARIPARPLYVPASGATASRAAEIINRAAAAAVRQLTGGP